MVADDGRSATRPDDAARGPALELRWPSVVRDDPDPEALVVDVVNVGDARWVPVASFHTVGGLTPTGGVARGIDFAFVGGTPGAVPLDPGDSTRVPVHVATSEWRDLEPGEHEARATMPSLGIRTADPLPVRVTAAMIARHVPGAVTALGAAADRGAVETQITADRARLAAGAELEALGATLARAESHEDAIARIVDLIGVDAEGAQQVLSSFVRWLLPYEMAETRRRLARSESRRDALGDGPAGTAA
ncbi:hypothetical protein [Clavibacter michiganensis]|uniref:Uncharacterized protein n=1 Tax=Clavibacter michiganensis subsp. insidiosus TaxID=33014 RepID=A0A0D5CHT8_9MICO|nr:hypothetical protein [Clavibacter michiganensis]AJW79208.1 hypothetical protein VO01_08785 [Clavibacter michiganensis subsp. insidiosus]AWF98074.1 hypothetical protein BEH61_06090 [Clavibacter michiganensis subsp. insidiosus]AWG01726.1 hypothetical protein BEH62_08985 [Clavibacter michiganensis subsp. insidiosus]OQJ59758.1 hypothetical protein B5P21_07440 [Clavibacter michiganensis subsp. insidiosus]RII85919.1 hypothetical protein DZF92_12480 [Clavibacter michiganensis subsp. insidiosus]